MKKSRKGFVTTQIMIYGFAIIVAVLILFWAFKSIKTFSETSTQSALSEFEVKFKKDIESLAIKRGAVSEYSYLIPSGYDKFCAFDFDRINISKPETLPDLFDEFPQMRDSAAYDSENAFLLSSRTSKAFGIRMETLKFETPPFFACVNITNENLKFKARGYILGGEPVVTIVTS